MNARELAIDFPLGPGDPRQALLYARLLLSYLADHVHHAELANGCPVRDVTDFSMWCRELIEEARKIGNPDNNTEVFSAMEFRTGTKVTLPPPPQPRYLSERTCQDCFHEHEGRDECGFYLGEGRFCHCPSKVAA